MPPHSSPHKPCPSLVPLDPPLQLLHTLCQGHGSQNERQNIPLRGDSQHHAPPHPPARCLLFAFTLQEVVGAAGPAPSSCRYRHTQASPFACVGKRKPATRSPSTACTRGKAQFCWRMVCITSPCPPEDWLCKEESPLSQTSWVEVGSNAESPQESPQGLRLGTGTKPP